MLALVYVVIGCLTITLLSLFVVNSRYSPLKPLSRAVPPATDPNAEPGSRGQHLVRFFHLNNLPRDEYTLYHGLAVPTGAADRAQVDHIVVSRYGVFVVETKTWSGEIEQHVPFRMDMARFWFWSEYYFDFNNNNPQIALEDMSDGQALRKVEPSLGVFGNPVF